MRVTSRGLHDALTELYLDLVGQAEAMEKDHGALGATAH